MNPASVHFSRSRTALNRAVLRNCVECAYARCLKSPFLFWRPQVKREVRAAFVSAFAHCPRNGDWNTLSRCTTGGLFGSGKVTKRNAAQVAFVHQSGYRPSHRRLHHPCCRRGAVVPQHFCGLGDLLRRLRGRLRQLNPQLWNPLHTFDQNTVITFTLSLLRFGHVTSQTAPPRR